MKIHGEAEVGLQLTSVVVAVVVVLVVVVVAVVVNTCEGFLEGP